MCYHTEFGRSVLKGVGINACEPQNWVALELGIGGVADTDTHPSPHVLHVKIDSSVSKGVRINRRESKNWGALWPRPWGGGVADP